MNTNEKTCVLPGQYPLPLPDLRKARADRIAAEYALRDIARTPAERQARHDWYMAQAIAAERGENISQNLAEIA
jgi:hypothetical protein